MVREGLKGDELDANVTYRDLVDIGVATSERYKPRNPRSPVSPAAISDNTAPADVEGIRATGSITSVFVSWNQINNPSHAYVEVWRTVNPNDISTAVKIGTASGMIYVDYDVVPGTDYWYFIRAVSKNNKPGAFNQEGVRATPAADPAGVIATIEAAGGYAIAGQPFYYVPQGGVTIGGQFIPEGTYLWNAVIANATITGLMVAQATITSANVAELSADKIVFDFATGKVFTAAVIVGGHISGTTIEGNTILGGHIDGALITAGGTVEIPAVSIDGETGHLRLNGEIQDPLVAESYDYTEFSDGKAVDAFYVPEVGQVRYSILNRVASGVGNSNEWVELPGYWRTMPEIMVSPNELTLFDSSAAGVTQKATCVATNLERLSDNPNELAFYKVRFQPLARLEVTAGGRTEALGEVVRNAASGSTFSYTGYGSLGGSFETDPFIFPANTTLLQVSSTTQAWEWTDLSGYYGYRYGARFTPSVYVSYNNGATWTLLTTFSSFATGEALSTWTRSLTLLGTNAAGLAKVVYTVSVGSLLEKRTVYNTDSEQNGYTRTFDYRNRWMKNYIRCNSVTYSTAASNTILNGSLNWFAVGANGGDIT
jgi:hypothetical protein